MAPSSTPALSGLCELDRGARSSDRSERNGALRELGHNFGQLRSQTSRVPAIQPKLRVNVPGDKYEREAERTSDRIVGMPDPRIPQQKRPQSALSKTSEMSSSDSQPLDAQTREFMEPRFGFSFTDVRVHTGARAAATTMVLSARAYTTGRDIFFGQGEYAPHTQAGRRLLAHELTHVCQQSQNVANAKGLRISKASTPMIQRQTVKDAELRALRKEKNELEILSGELLSDLYKAKPEAETYFASYYLTLRLKLDTWKFK